MDNVLFCAYCPRGWMQQANQQSVACWISPFLAFVSSRLNPRVSIFVGPHSVSCRREESRALSQASERERESPLMSPMVPANSQRVGGRGGGWGALRFLPFLTQLVDKIFIIPFLGLVSPQVHLHLQNLLQGCLWSCVSFYCTQLFSLSGFAIYPIGPTGK